MKAVFSILILVALTILTASGQVTELWRTGTTNNVAFDGDYEPVAAASDFASNLIIAGKGLSRGPFIAKFSPYGAKLWQWSEVTMSRRGAQTLAVDSQGNIFTAFMPSLDAPNPIDFIKISPNGTVIWRVQETSIGWGGDANTAAGVAIDKHGNSIWLAMRAIVDVGDSYRFVLFVTKISPQGKVLWQTHLPASRYIMGLGGMAHSISVAPDGDILVCGGVVKSLISSGSLNLQVPVTVGFIAKLDARGRIIWNVEEPNGTGAGIFSGVLPTQWGGAVAGGTGGTHAVTRHGRLGNWIPGRTVAVSSDHWSGTAFTEYGGNYLRTVNPDGDIRWRSWITSGEGNIGVVSDQRGGFVAVSPSIDHSYMEVAGVDIFGNRTFHGNLPDFGFSFPPRQLRANVLVACPDGSYRVVANLSQTSYFLSPLKVRIAAFRTQAPAGSPHIYAPPQTVHWDGRSDVTFRVGVSGRDRLTYQWQHWVFPIDGATNAVLRIPRDLVPSYAGYIHAKITNQKGTTDSAIAELVVPDSSPH